MRHILRFVPFSSLLLAWACAQSLALVPVSAPTSSRVDAHQVHSVLLNSSIRVLVYLPAGYTASERYPVLYLLHGLPGTPDALFQNLDLANALDGLIAAGDLPATIVVAPTGGPTPATDTEWSDSSVDPSQRWGSFLSAELIPWVDRSFSTCADRTDRAVAGLSMGAFGAMNLGLKNRNLFGAVSAWSGYYVANTPSVEGHPGTAAWKADSPLRYVAGLHPTLANDPIRMSFYVGASDRFAASNRALDRVLMRLGVPHRFRFLQGGHDWTLWRDQLSDELTWAGRGFSCTPVSNAP